MKSKVKYAVLILVIGLLGLAILASPVFGVKPDIKLYTVEISGVINSAVGSDSWFETGGNKPRTRFNPFPKEELPVKVMLDFDPSVLPPDGYIYDSTEHCFRWSPLEGEDGVLQDLDEIEWEFHHISIRSNTLDCRFDLKEYIYEGAWDHYIIGIHMELWKNGVSSDATINWTHYTEKTKPRGKTKLDIEFQHLEYPESGQPSLSGELTITITEKTD